MSASISRHQLFTPQVLQRKKHSWLSVIVKACCNSKKQTGARWIWVSWGPLGSCGKTLLHKGAGWAHFWNCGETQSSAPQAKFFQTNICQEKIFQPPYPNAIKPILSSHSLSICASKQVNTSSNPPSSPFYLMVYSADGRACQSPW